MDVKVSEICKIVNGSLQGNGDLIINKISPIEVASKGTLSFLSNPKYNHYLEKSKASAILVHRSFKSDKLFSPALIFVDDVYSTLSILLEKFTEPYYASKKGKEKPCCISESAILGKDIYIGAFSYIGENVEIGDNVKIFPNTYIGDNVSIGKGTVLYPGVKIYHDCKIGEYCILHAGSVVGGDGFGFAPLKNGTYQKTPQTGIVDIRNFVEIGANTTIDRATIDSTIIHNGVKLDNLIQIAHNVEIGENTVIAAQTGVSGSTKIEANCIIAGQVGIVGHINIAKGTIIGAKSGIGKSIKIKDSKWHGIPAEPYSQTLKSQVIFRSLPILKEKIDLLEKEILKIKGNKSEQ